MINIFALTAAQPQPGDVVSSLSSFVILIATVVIFYFLLIRPQRKRDKELRAQMDALKVGDQVTTIGGIVGKVANIKDDEITISTSVANTLITFKKSSISTVVKRDDIGKAKPDEEPKSLFGNKKKKKEESEE